MISYDPKQCAALGGIDVALEKQKSILESLGFAVDSNWQVTPPTWRRDIAGWQDLVEEVVRIEGLDSVPSTPLPAQSWRCQTHGIAGATGRAQGTAGCRSARVERDRDLELYL